ncbi:MAG: RidA family protein [Rothia sp. (in: high G+C Gram-positive bacteria)]|nr:RidA family protein [Rothia sp. (in: high G+C Gram-positive bacteria)]
MSENNSQIIQKLKELGYTLPQAPQPVAAYVPAVTSGNHLYTSGQLPFVAGQLPQTGKVSESGLAGYVSPEEAYRHAAQAALNGLAAAQQLLGNLDRISKVVKVVGFVASDPSFTGQPAVINGASELLGQIFGEAGIHARSALGVAVLPLDAPVEVELILEYD